MNWILDNLQLVLVIAGSIAYWLNQRKKEQQGESADYDGDGVPDREPVAAPRADAIEEEMRTRRIQEEIRRKIQERQSDGSRVPKSSPASELRPVYEAPPDLPWREVVAAAEPPLIDEGVLARQRALQEQMRVLAEHRAAMASRTTRINAIAAGDTERASVRAAKAAGLRETLRNPDSVRRAIILREVLGPPVALR